MKTKLSFEHEAMTTRFEVIISGEDPTYARQAANAVFCEIDRLETVLSKYDHGSDVGQINLCAAGSMVRVGIETIECLAVAAWAHKLSGGLFDPTLGTGFDRLIVDHENFQVGWKASGKASLDLGGVGKGFALDKAAEILEDWEVEKVLLNGGTSTVLAKGCDWTIGVGGPWGLKVGNDVIDLRDAAASGSGTEVKGGHIINPKTGKPARQHLAAWAVHTSAAKSDALSTSFMMMTEESIRNVVKENPEITAYVVTQNETLIKIGV